MADPILVQILDAGEDLVEKATSFAVLQATLLHNVVKKFAAAGVLHDEEKLLRGLYDLVQLDDVGVADDLQNVDLSHDPRDVGLVLDLVLLEDLDRDLLLGQLVNALAHLAEGAGPERLTHHVVADKPAIGGFLATLGRLPVTLLCIGLLLLEFS